jgi:REP element-mobilizing transposase RayT
MVFARAATLPQGGRGTYHVITRCTRRAFLMGEARGHRRGWLADSISEMVPHFGIDLVTYAIMSNHLHLIVRLRPERVDEWTPLEAARHALNIFPARTGWQNEALPLSAALVENYSEHRTWLKQQRDRLKSLSWFMRVVKQGISRRANGEDECRGHFWESRFQNVALLDEAAVIACMVYVDLNPIRAGMAKTIRASSYSGGRGRLLLNEEAGENDWEHGERALAKRMVGMRSVAPVHAVTGEELTSWVNGPDYLQILESTHTSLSGAAKGSWHHHLVNACTRLSLDIDRWRQVMGEGGKFSGTALGSASTRQRLANHLKREWIADKSELFTDRIS